MGHCSYLFLMLPAVVIASDHASFLKMKQSMIEIMRHDELWDKDNDAK